jgi:hypothetical protein
MTAETITAIAAALSGPAGGLVVMGGVLYGVYKTATTILTPFLSEVGSGIKKGFDDQTSTLGKLVEEIKSDRDFHRENIRGLTGRIDKIEADVGEIKDDVSDIKKIVEK